MRTDQNLRLTYRYMERVQGSERHVCFKVVSGYVINRLRKWDHSLPIDNAVGIMLEVIPQLDHYTLSNAPLEEWYATLKIYGFGTEADTLAVATDNEAFLRSDAANPQSAVSPSLQIPTAIITFHNRPSPLHHDESPSGMSNHEGENDEDRLSTPGSQDFVDVNLSAKRTPYSIVDASPDGQQTFEQLFQPGRTQASEGAGTTRRPGLTYDRSNRPSFRTPSLESDGSDSSMQSTPRPMKRRSMDVNVERDNNSDSVYQLTSRPIKRGRKSNDATDSDEVDSLDQSTPRAPKKGRMNMGALRGSLPDVQRENDGVLGTKVAKPSSEGNEVCTQSLPGGSGAGDDFAAAALQIDEDAMEVDTAAVARDNDIAAMEVKADNNQETVEVARKQTEDEKPQIEKGDAGISEPNRTDETITAVAEDGGIGSNDQPSEANPTKWQDIYAEYYSWPRNLKIYDEIEMTLYNCVRRDMLKCLSQAEETKSARWWDNCPAEQRRFNSDALDSDLKAIKAAVQSAMNQGPRKGTFRTLAEEIDLDGEGITFDEVTKTVFKIIPDPVSNEDNAVKGDNDDQEENDDAMDSDEEPTETDPTKWRDAYTEYKCWPRTLKIYGKVELMLHNGLRKDMLKTLSQSEVTGVPCWWELDPKHHPKDRKRCTTNLEFDLESIRDAVELAMKQSRRKGKSKGKGKFRTLAEVIDQDEEGVKFDKVTKQFLTTEHDIESSEEEEEEEDSHKWRNMYAEYKAFPRDLRIYDQMWLMLFNAERKSVLKALSRAEARGTVCYVDELDEEERDDMYEAIEFDMDAIRTVVRDAKKRKYHSGPCDRLRHLIDDEEDSVEYNDGTFESFNPEDGDGDTMMED
jgi:hypothetical protein